MSEIFIYRPIGVGYSGGEKKRMEILQMAMLKPTIAFLDEPDSGLDIDSLKTVADVVNSIRCQDLGMVVITHYQRILNYIKPQQRITKLKLNPKALWMAPIDCLLSSIA